MIRTGAMQLSQLEPGDPVTLWLQGLLADGGLWTDARRLADHDHSGGLNGAPVAGAGSGVTSVNGETGAVVLDAADVGAMTQAQADTRYLQLTGGALSGALTVQGLAVGLSGAAGNTLTWTGAGLYSDAPTRATHDALASRVATLEAQVATLLVHVHSHGTFGATTAPEAP